LKKKESACAIARDIRGMSTKRGDMPISEGRTDEKRGIEKVLCIFCAREKDGSLINFSSISTSEKKKKVAKCGVPSFLLVVGKRISF